MTIPNTWVGFDFGLGPDVEMLRKSVHDFAQDRIAPRAAAIDRDNIFPRDLWPEMGALVITHYQRILNYIEPDFVHVFVDGRIVEEGGPELAHELEKSGYAKWEKEKVEA